ncbi:hypothetical protein D021_0393A, partial [Vibrio parahaemolyticus 10296]
MDCG